MHKKLFLYRFDLFMLRLRKGIKAVLPPIFLRTFEQLKGQKGNAIAAIQMLNGDDYPWMSPNIWGEIVSFYRTLDSPAVLEFGTGTSTIRHFEELLDFKNASYIGIENDPTWFWAVIAALLNKANYIGEHISIQIENIGGLKGAASALGQDVDVEFRCENMTLLLRLRTSVDRYVDALDLPCDVIVVDGISRKKCIHKILNSSWLRRGGLLMLMEAGRGSEQWWEGKLEGDGDYRAELKAMMSLGGEILDGSGLDHWVGCSRRSPRPVSYYYPMEACKLVLR